MQPVAHVSEYGGLFSAYGIGWMLFYLAFGAVLYTIDRSYLQGFYRWCYDICHKEPLTAKQGFVYGHKVSYKVVVAGVISTLETFGFLFFTTFNSNPFTELTLWLINMPMMVMGMGIGARIYPLWLRRGKAYEAAEKLGDKIDQVAENIEKKATGVKTPVASPPVATPAPVTPAPATPPTESKLTPEERIRQYASKR